VAITNGPDKCLGFTIRDMGRRLSPDVRAPRELPRSASQMTELVGRMPLKDIVRVLPRRRQTLLFSATMSGPVAKIAAEHKLIVTVDPSPRNPLPWAGVSLVKPNRLEAFAAAGLEDHLLTEAPLENQELLEVGRVLLAKWNVASVLVTLGEQGMMLFERGQPPHHIPTRAREVFDVSGAGDTAIALLTLALASGHSLREAADISNHASGIVVGKLGTATLTPDELLAAFASK
jgi:D-beta-D-heptose 7-phosphate kinase/D-beta-D-heptose 1-phosphate adenosyltransferase